MFGLYEPGSVKKYASPLDPNVEESVPGVNFINIIIKFKHILNVFWKNKKDRSIVNFKILL